MNPWIEAMRLRTLPCSIAGVIAGTGYAFAAGAFRPLQAALCLIFAVLAQIASNFANEYYDYRSGLDRPGREGPRRGVTEGDITPRAMAIATYATLALACAVGLVLAYLAGWWLIAAGIAIAVGVVAYSTGPWPLSHHGLGEVAVIVFFGIIPVSLTYYVQAGTFAMTAAPYYVASMSWALQPVIGSVAIGLLGANILIVNNYRDADDDRAVGKRTTAVLFGRRAVALWYLVNGYLAVLLMLPMWLHIGLRLATLLMVAFLVAHTLLWQRLRTTTGAALNPLLGRTALLLLAYSLAFLALAI